MFQIGQFVRIDAVPEDYDFWNLPNELIGLTATVINCDRPDYNGIACLKLRIVSDHGNQWYFPSNDIPMGQGLLTAIKDPTRWNPTGYVPRTTALPLP